jgi:glutamine phosphoribosylpyrophosphate amidotransferase
MMCGLWGFFGSRVPDAGLIEDVATLAARRGPDGWGYVTEFHTRRDVGRIEARHLRGVSIGRHIIGHCRLATVAGTKHAEASQPIQVGRHLVAHNGTVENVADVCEAFGFKLRTGVDSEVIAHLIGRLPGTLHDRLQATVDTIDHGGHCALAVMDTDAHAFELIAIGMPLWRLVAQEGIYWCSVRPGEEWEQIQ